MKAKLEKVMAGVRRVFKAAIVRLTIWYLILQVTTNGLPAVKVWLDQAVASVNGWFAGLAPWCRTAVNAVANFIAPIYRWAPLAFHAAALALIAWAAWRILCLVVKTTDSGTHQQQPRRPHQPQRQRPQGQPQPQNPPQNP